MTKQPTFSTPAVWARFRFSVVGALLSAPPTRGELKTALESLAAKTWTHPVSGRQVRFAAKTIERWLYRARQERDDPVGGLRRAVRKDSGKVSLKPELDLSVILVHHTRKNAAGGVAAGQGLRGSGDIHAFGDSNLYLRRVQQRLVLSSEHRAAAASPPVDLELVSDPAETIHLEVVGERQDEPRRTLEDQVLQLLTDGVVLSRTKLREALSVQNQRLGQTLALLERAGRIRHTSTGWQRAD